MQHAINLRRLARLAAAIACAFAALVATVAGDANAAAVHDARASGAAATPHLDMPKPTARSARDAGPAAGARPMGFLPRTVGFRNSYGKTVSVAIMRHDPDRCGGYGDWRTQGWWVLAPGEEKRVMTTTNGYAAYYAKAVDGREWTGNYGPVAIYDGVFDSCLGIGSTAASATVGMRLIDLRSASLYHYINLIP